MTIKVLKLECSNLVHSDERINKIVSDFIDEFIEINKVKTYRHDLISTFDHKIHEMIEEYIKNYFVANPYLKYCSIFIRVFDNDNEYDNYFNDMIKYEPKNFDYINHMEAYQFNDQVDNSKINVSFIGITSNKTEKLKEWKFYVLVKI